MKTAELAKIRIRGCLVAFIGGVVVLISMPTDEATMETLDYLDDKGYELGSFVTAGYSGFSSLLERSPELALDWLYQRKPDQLDEVIRFYFRHWDGDDASRSSLSQWLQRTLGDSGKVSQYRALLEK